MKQNETKQNRIERNNKLNNVKAQVNTWIEMKHNKIIKLNKAK